MVLLICLSQNGQAQTSDSTGRGYLKIAPASYFSPNGDGYHDVWQIGNINYHDDFLLNVYNRWGTRVYQQVGTYVEWTGRSGGAALPMGTYYWIVYEHGTEKDSLRKGTVSIIR